MQPQMRQTTDPARESPPAAVGASPFADDPPPSLRQWLRNLAIAAAAGAFMALVGAMDTSRLPLWHRLLYWVPLTMAGGVLGHALALYVAKIPHARLNPWLFGTILTFAIAVPATFVVWGYTGLVVGDWMPITGLPMLFIPVLVITAAMTALMTALNWPGRVTHAPAPGATAQPVRLMERLPPKLKGAAIYAVSAEDHYLRLHTSKGTDLILMRLADAIAELEGLEGAQTHRSWWVARDAVESAGREGDRAVLVLKGGVEAPVSRPNVKPLRDAGWF
ncbi:MAG TPA: LytTR family DNA-binding domain-containing protein [Vitreimonas sp.]|nr:LytTR family DNA-binding domain-containing protein [Vitreimonas sp.]